MKILTLNYEFPPVGGGGGRASYELCRELVRQGHAVDVVTMHYGDLPREETRDGIHIYRTPAIRKRPHLCRTHEMASYIAGALGPCRAMLRQQGYDLVHCHFLIPTGVLATLLCRKTQIPFVITAHGSDVPGYNPDRFQWEHRFTRPFLRMICRNAERIVSPSNYLKQLMENRIGAGGIEIIPNGIELMAGDSDFPDTKTNILLSAGRLLRRKGFHTLIDSVHDAALPMEVHIVGDGPMRGELERQAMGSRTPIVFHGWLDNHDPVFADLYKRASVFVLVSSRENASISLLEAMAAKCAVITSNISGCPETVGDAGFLIGYEDTDALREILIRLAGNPQLCREYGRKAYQRVREVYSWERIARRYAEVFEKVRKPQ